MAAGRGCACRQQQRSVEVAELVGVGAASQAQQRRALRCSGGLVVPPTWALRAWPGQPGAPPQPSPRPQHTHLHTPTPTQVEVINLFRERRTHISKGCGFVTMATRQQAMAAMEALDGATLLNGPAPPGMPPPQPLAIKWADPDLQVRVCWLTY